MGLALKNNTGASENKTTTVSGRLVWVLSLCLIVSVFIMVFIRSQENLSNEDTIYHLRMGKIILEEGLPKLDMLSFSAAHKPWPSHEWLWQLFIFRLTEFAGINSIVWLQSLLLIVGLGLLFFWGYRKDLVFLVAIGLLAVTLVRSDRCLIRVDMVSLFLSVLFMVLMDKGLNKRWVLVLLFLLQVIWVNIHGFFIFGPLVAILFFIAEFIKRHCPLPWEWKRASSVSPEEYTNLKILPWLLMGGCLINPEFLQGAIYPLKILFAAKSDSAHLYTFISELQRPFDLAAIRNIHVQTGYKIVFLLSGLSFLVNYRKIDLKVLFVWLAFLLFSSSAYRTLIFWGPPAYWVMMANLSKIDFSHFYHRNDSFSKCIRIACLGILVYLLTAVSQQIVMKIKNNKTFDPVSQTYVSAYGRFWESRSIKKILDFIVSNNLQGNFVNSLESGLHLSYRAYPHIKTFFDGRVEIYDREVFDQYVRIRHEGDWELFNQLAQKHDVSGFLLTHLEEGFPANDFLKKMIHSDLWKLVYLDYDGVVFLKNSTLNQAVIQKNLIDLDRWETGPTTVSYTYPDPAIAQVYLKRAVLLEALGFPQKARTEMEQALIISPSDSDLLLRAAKLDGIVGNYSAQVEKSLVLLNQSPRSIKLMLLGLIAYLNNGQWDEANEISLRMLKQQPQDPRCHLGRGLVFLAQGLEQNVWEALDKALDLGLDVALLTDLVESADRWNKVEILKRVASRILERNNLANDIRKKLVTLTNVGSTEK